jgi:hypothetical protein
MPAFPCAGGSHGTLTEDSPLLGGERCGQSSPFSRSLLLQLAFDGLLLDRLTAPDARGIEDLDLVIEQLTRRLLAR